MVVVAVAERGGLAEHVQPVGLLVRRRPQATSGEAAPPVAVDPLGGHAEPADVEALERIADLVGRAALGDQPSALLVERRDERRGADPHLVPGPRLEQHRLAAADGLVLEAADDRAGARPPRG